MALRMNSMGGRAPIGRLPAQGIRSAANLNPTPLTVTTNKSSRPMSRYLGAYDMSNRDYQARPADNTEVAVWTAPEGQRGVEDLGDDFLLLTEIDLSFVTRRLLRLLVTNSREYQWEETEFGTHYPDGMPYLGAVRIMGSSRHKGRATIRRHGFGAMLEHGFMETERGKRHFAMVLKQMEVSWQEFLDARGLEAIISSSEFTTKWLEVNGDPGRSIRMNYVAQLEKRDWAALQKRTNAYAKLVQDMKDDHRQVMKDVPVLDTVIMTQSIASFHPLRAEDQVTASIFGPDAVRNVQRGVMGFSTDEFGHIIYKTGLRSVTEEGAFDPLDELAMIGEHWKTLDGRLINPNLYQHGDYDFQIYDQNKDNYVDITLQQLIENDHRFHPNSKSVPVGLRDTPISFDDPSLSNGSDAYTFEERDMDFYHIRDTNTGEHRPIQFWGDLGVEHISPDYVAKAAQVQFNRISSELSSSEFNINSVISDAVNVIRIASSYEYNEGYEALLRASVAGSQIGVSKFGNGFGRVLAYKGNNYGGVVPISELGQRVQEDLNAFGGNAGGNVPKYIFSPIHLTPGGLRTMAASVKTDEKAYGENFSVEDGKKIARAIELIDKMCDILKQFNPGTATIDRQFSMPHHSVRNDADTFIETFLLEEARAVPVFHISDRTAADSIPWYGPDRALAEASERGASFQAKFDNNANDFENALNSLKANILYTVTNAIGQRLNKANPEIVKEYGQKVNAIRIATTLSDVNDASDLLIEVIRSNSDILIEGGITTGLTGAIKEEIENFQDRVEAARTYRGEGVPTDVVSLEEKIRKAASNGALVFAPVSMAAAALKSWAKHVMDGKDTEFVPASQRHPASPINIEELIDALKVSDETFFTPVDDDEGGREYEKIYSNINSNKLTEAQVADKVDSVFLSPKEYGIYLKSDPRHSSIIQTSLVNAQAVKGIEEDQGKVAAPFSQNRQNYGDMMAQRRREAERGMKRGYDESSSLISATSRYNQNAEQRQLHEELERLSKHQREVEDSYGAQYEQETSKVQSTTGALTQFLHRVLSTRFSMLYHETAKATQHNNILRWIAITILFTPVSNTSRHAWHRFGLLPLHRWLIFRPHMSYGTSMMIMCTGDLGNTMVMPPELGIGNDVVTGMLMLTAKLSSASVVKRRKHIIVRHHVYINSLLGGSGSMFIDFDENYSMIAGKYGRSDEHALFACAIPMNEEITEHLLNITGNMSYNDERGQAMYVSEEVAKPLCYSTAPFYNLRWRWHEAKTNELFHPGVSAKHRPYYMPGNVYTWEAVGLYRRNGAIATRTTQFGHWDLRMTGPGCKDLRNGGCFSENSPWFSTYTRLESVSLR